MQVKQNSLWLQASSKSMGWKHKYLFYKIRVNQKLPRLEFVLCQETRLHIYFNWICGWPIHQEQQTTCWMDRNSIV